MNFSQSNSFFKLGQPLLWLCIVLLGTGSIGYLALARGETINSLWLLTAGLCVYAVAYRFYARWIDRVVLKPDQRPTPAHYKADGLDYIPTHKTVLFGHHFAAIAGAGPLVGPILAAQMGYLPGTLWILVGVVFAGAVQDMIVLFASMRSGGKSLIDLIRQHLGKSASTLVGFGILVIMMILLGVLSLVVVKALALSPWGTFTVLATLPIAILMGLYLRFFRPDAVLEVSLLGCVLLGIALVSGESIAQGPWAHWFNFSAEHLAIGLMIYAFVASVLPVWLLLAPRDYLSTFLKIGTILLLAIGIVITQPELKMPSITPFIDGTGPVFAGELFPFLFITIACGAVSGFHALVSSGTTPKMIEHETHVKPIGYGAMLMESFVALMAMIAACVLEPGHYFALNSPASVIGTSLQSASATIQAWGFQITPESLDQLAKDIGESHILSRSGGAPTFAIGMAKILSDMIGGKSLMALWYHFAILFEALFILTTLDAGTRVGRFLIQDALGQWVPAWKNTHNWTGNILATALCVSCWGYLLYQGVLDPLGGINSLWPLFGIANQLLAAMALLVVSLWLVHEGKKRYVWVTLLPALAVLATTVTAALQKIFHSDPRIGFLAQADKYQNATNQGMILAPAKNIDSQHLIILNQWINSGLTFFLLGITLLLVFFCFKHRKQAPTSEGF